MMRFVHIQGVCAVALILAASLVVGCARTARPLMPTPTLYQESGENELFAATPAERLPRKQLVLDMDSSESPTHGQQEGSSFLRLTPGE